MTTPLAAQSLVSALSAWWRGREEVSRNRAEIASLSEHDLAGVAADCGVSTHDLLTLIQAGPHAADEMKDMLEALGISANTVENRDRRLFQDMMATCAECQAKARCRDDLRRGQAAENHADYCPNADTIDSLRAIPEMLAS